MKTIYVNKELFKEAMDYLNRDITFYEFLSYTKAFLKQLLSNPTGADIEPYLKENGLTRESLLNSLMNKGIVERETKIDEVNGSDKFSISYRIPKKNFERKMRRLFSQLFEKNEISESIITEDGEGGATSCGSAMQGGGSNPDAGQFLQPIGKVQRRKIYLTQEQADMLKETATQDAGNYQYDVPLNFNNGNDPTYNHKDIIASSIPKKKKVVRRKNK
jgi:predicted transcriptional regulator